MIINGLYLMRNRLRIIITLKLFIMKQKLLYLFSLLFIGISNLCYAQSGALTDLVYDATVEQGASDLTFTFNYTSSEDVTIEWQLTPANEDGSPTYNGQVSYNQIQNLTATDTPTEVSFNYSIAGSAVIGQSYTWAGKFTPAGGGNDFGYNNTNNLVEITAAAGVLNTISLTSNLPDVLQTGQEITAEFEYTLTEDGQVKFALEKQGPTPNYGVDGAESYINPAMATTSDPVSGSLTITINANTIPSEDLADGESYRLVVAIFRDSFQFIDQIAIPVTVNAVTAGIDDLNANGIVAYPNPVINELFLDKSRLNAQSLNIYDISGRNVRSINNLQTVNSINVSNLSKGLYFVVTDTKKQFKFIKG